MYVNLRKAIKVLILLVVFTSCVSNKNVAYFQFDDINQKEVNNVYKTVFKPDDLLQITISSEDIEATQPFNLPTVSFSSTTNAATGTPRQQSYLIDSNGEIDFPVFGKLKLGGLTREQAIKLLKIKLAPDYVKNPTVNISISNFKITVTGDVKQPGTFNIPNERVSVLDAIGLAGDLNISGRRDNVMIIREIGSEKNIYKIDLRSKKALTSPVFYLQQNDVIYVEHNNAKIQSASYNQNTGLFISIGSILISLIAVLVR